MSALDPGTPAPEFELTRRDGTKFSEKELEGPGTAFVFYPFAF